MADQKLSRTMQDAISYAQKFDNKIVRYPGGFWARENWQGERAEHYFGTTTIQALVDRKLARYTNWQDGRSGRFPTEITLVSEPRSSQLTEDAVREIEARAGAGMTSDILALIRDWRAMYTANEWQKSSIEHFQTAISGCAERLAQTTHENAALREQLAQAEKERDDALMRLQIQQNDPTPANTEYDV